MYEHQNRADHSKDEPTALKTIISGKPVDNFDKGDGEQERQEVSNVVVRREIGKSILALSILVGAGCFIGLGIPAMKDDFVEPDCTGVISDRSCSACGKGTYFLPLFGEWERTWDRWVRITLYFIGLFWTFMGVGMVCDQFMAAIEEITVSERVVWVEVHSGARRKFVVKKWNATIANLSLMALGSSAPEILLSATELVFNDCFAGKLGPSTIVGSAAFNLLIITAVCICAIPAPTIRKIENVEVFITTTSISIFAYLWLLVILLLWTPDKVDLWESVVTLFMFPMLLILAFMADKGCFSAVIFKCIGDRDDGSKREKLKEREAQLQARYGKQLPQQAVKLMMDCESIHERSSLSRAQLRRNVMSALTGASALPKSSSFCDDSLVPGRPTTSTKALVFGFKEERYMVLECAGSLCVKVVANRAPESQVDIRYYTMEGSAKQGMRFEHVEGVISFAPSQREANIMVPIIDNNDWDPDEEFYVVLTEVPSASETAVSGVRHSWSSSASKSRGPRRTPTAKMEEWKFGVAQAVITVLNDDMPGVLNFDADEIQTSQGSTATIGVERSGGSSGKIQCRYKTSDCDATEGQDYIGVSGILVFEDGETHRKIQVPVLQSRDTQEAQYFQMALYDASPGVKFNANSGGTEDEATCDIIVLPSRPPGMLVRWFRSMFRSSQWRLAFLSWKDQFVQALFCNGSVEDQCEATILDWILHVFALFWKLLFALVPPPSIAGGWACFYSALLMIGCVTAFVGEIASLLGCSIGMPDEVTAITLVALGTSLPDTFASRAAATQDDTADNSVGNIMGSNSVNVFLGLGTSWTVGSVYWLRHGVTPEWLDARHAGIRYEDSFFGTYPEGGFIVPAGTLLFSVVVYCSCAMLCIALVAYRRCKYGGELGGPKGPQYRDSAFLVSLWVIYIAASTIYASASES